MPEMHPCFISYVHPREKWGLDATQKLIGAIKSALDPYTREPICYDKDRMLPGYNHEEILATDICRSAVMIVLYLPAYLESDYCRRELEAMRRVEVLRRDLLGDRLRGKRM